MQHTGHQMLYSHHSHKGRQGHDHSGHHAQMIVDFRNRFWISLIMTVPILILSPLNKAFSHADVSSRKSFNLQLMFTRGGNFDISSTVAYFECRYPGGVRQFKGEIND